MIIRGARLLCPASGLDRVGDLRVDGGRIAALDGDGGGEEVDGRGKVLFPALVDLEARLCDPGLTWRETLATGGRAAARGGFTALLAHPGTRPVMDDPAPIRELRQRAASECAVELLVAGAFTKGLAGAELAEIGLLLEAGACALSNGDGAISSTLLLRNALLYSRPFQRPVLLRAADPELEGYGVVHEGVGSMAAGLRGVPSAAEEMAVARIVALVRSTGARVHVLGLSTAEGVEIIRRARAEGQPLSASTTAHHLLLDENDVLESGYDPDFRLRPPLRSSRDREALRAGVREGWLSVASGHDPLTAVEKEHELDRAQPGATALETTLAAAVESVGLEAAVRALSASPAEVLGLRRRMEPGAPAHLVLFDPEARWLVRREDLVSKGKNTPLHGRAFRGRVEQVWHAGSALLGG